MKMRQLPKVNTPPNDRMPHASLQVLSKKFPFVSIGMPTYNSGGKIKEALFSICRQEYGNIEVIISDNCSTDNTEELCVEMSRNYFPVKYFRQVKNIGMVENFKF